MPRRKGAGKVYQGIKGKCNLCQWEGDLTVDKGAVCPRCHCPIENTRLNTRVDTPLPVAEIPYPKNSDRNNEIVIQVYLLTTLRAMGWDAHLEIRPKRERQKNVGGTQEKKRGKRFDIVIYKDRLAVRIIEVKGKDPLPTAKVTDTGDEFVCWHYGTKAEHQLNRYRAYGLPVDYILGMRMAEKYIEWATNRGRPER
jgi:hypothetical protein